jgi:hypothetical protein
MESAGFNGGTADPEYISVYCVSLLKKVIRTLRLLKLRKYLGILYRGQVNRMILILYSSALSTIGFSILMSRLAGISYRLLLYKLKFT